MAWASSSLTAWWSSERYVDVTVECLVLVAASTELKLYNVCILPIMLYGSECWALSRVDARKVDALDQWCLRRILDIRWYHRVSNCEVRRLTEQPPLTSIIQKRRLTLFGHLVRRDKSADARRILTAVPRVSGEGQLGDPTPPGWPL